jgi:peptide/nickel transport system ATP-binding protein
MPDPTRRRVDNPALAALQGEIPSPIDVPKGCYLASRCPHVVDKCRTNSQILTDLGDDRAVRCERVVNKEITNENEVAHD